MENTKKFLADRTANDVAIGESSPSSISKVSIACKRLMGALVVVALTVGFLSISTTAASASTRAVSSQAVAYASNAQAWPMLGNQTYDDCTIAAAGDLIQAWNDELGLGTSTFSNAQAVNLFTSLGGTTTQGVAIDSLVGKWQTTGLYGSTVSSSAQLNPTDVATTKQAIYLLGGVIAEVYLTPQTQLQLTKGQTVTSVAAGSPSLAHAITFIGYNNQYLTAVTFGHVVHVSWAWWLKNGVLEYGMIPQLFTSIGHGPAAGVSTNYLFNWLSAHND
jgi:hypothetical protein